MKTNPDSPDPTGFVTAEESRELDRRAIEEFGIPALLLMEHASLGVALFAREKLAERSEDDRRIRILCGPGNNGGDGYAVARHLSNADIEVEVIELIDPATTAVDSLAAIQRGMLVRQEVPIRTPSKTFDRPPDEPAIWVDAIFGTGLTRAPTGRFADAIRTMNASRAPVIAVDIPSGLDADRGIPLSLAVRAAWTLTFGAPKTGFLAAEAKLYVGELSLVSIGLPSAIRPVSAPGFPPFPNRVPIEN